MRGTINRHQQMIMLIKTKTITVLERQAFDMRILAAVVVAVQNAKEVCCDEPHTLLYAVQTKVQVISGAKHQAPLPIVLV